MKGKTVYVGGLPLYKIVPMEQHHLGAVVAVEEACFPRPWTRGIFDAEIRNVSRVSHPFVLTAQDGSMAGFLCLWKVVDELHVNNIAVGPDHRKKGLGEAMMAFAEEYGRRLGRALLTLEVREGNTSAISLYEKLGLKVVGRRKAYYDETGEDALIMTKGI